MSDTLLLVVASRNNSTTGPALNAEITQSGRGQAEHPVNTATINQRAPAT